MASDINQFVITGHTVKDAELFTTRNGKEILRFSVAVKNYYRQEGVGMESVSYIPISCFGNQAIALERMVKKGLYVIVAGRIVQSRYTDKSGQGRTAFNFNANAVRCVFPPKNADIGETEEELEEEVVEEENQW